MVHKKKITNKNKNKKHMKNLTVLPDVAKAGYVTQGVVFDADGNVSKITVQKVVLDENDGFSANDGDPLELVPSADDAAAISTAIGKAALDFVAANIPPAQ